MLRTSVQPSWLAEDVNSSLCLSLCTFADAQTQLKAGSTALEDAINGEEESQNSRALD